MTFAKLEDGVSGRSSRRPRVEASLHLVCNACPVLATMLPGNEPELKPQKIETEVFMLKKQPQNNYNKQPRQPLCCSLTVALHWLCCSCAIEQVHLVCFKLVQLVSQGATPTIGTNGTTTNQSDALSLSRVSL